MDLYSPIGPVEYLPGEGGCKVSPKHLVLSLCAVGAVSAVVGCHRKADLTQAPSARETELVQKKAQARAAYLSYLGALGDHYKKHGHYTKLISAERELDDLEDMAVYRPTQYAAPPTFRIAEAKEVDLVEKMAKARNDYRKHIEALDELARREGPAQLLAAAGEELADLIQVRRYPYLLVADLPPPGTTRPLKRIPAADELFRDGLHYYNQKLPLPLMYSSRKMRVALDKFNRIIHEYPESDKVDDAFFYAAEVLKEYFGENIQAVEYYKRAYEADPNTPHPAHFQRAVVLDYRLHQRDEALKEYRKELVAEAHQTSWAAKSRTDFSAARIRQLTGGY